MFAGAIHALTKVEGVDSAGVNLATERATVSIDPARVTAHDLKAAITKARYTAPAISLPSPDHKETQETAFGIEVMTCAACVRRVERALTRT